MTDSVLGNQAPDNLKKTGGKTSRHHNSWGARANVGTGRGEGDRQPLGCHQKKGRGTGRISERFTVRVDRKKVSSLRSGGSNLVKDTRTPWLSEKKSDRNRNSETGVPHWHQTPGQPGGRPSLEYGRHEGKRSKGRLIKTRPGQRRKRFETSATK